MDVVAGDGGMICMCWDPILGRGSLSLDAREVWTILFNSGSRQHARTGREGVTCLMVHIDQVHVHVRDVGHLSYKKLYQYIMY